MTHMTQLRRDVLSLLDACGPLSSNQIAIATGRNVSRAGMTLRLLVGHGLLRYAGVAVRQGHGQKPRIYAITEAGREFLARKAA